jgi:type I restriction enzyme S subunit
MSSKEMDSLNMQDPERELNPRLRFPEFRREVGWKKANLGDLFTERQEVGLTHLPLLSLTEKGGIIPQQETNRKNSSNSDKSKYLRVAPGDIAYNTMRMWEGRSAYSRLEGLVRPAYTVCAPKKGIHALFFSYYFKTQELIRQFRRYSQGLVNDTLNLKFPEFSRIRVAYPQLQEQQKIADCLSSIDELITAEAQKFDALKTHEKGLMQQLLPAKGQTAPRMRLPEFRDAEDWRSDLLGNIFETTSGGTPDRSRKEYWNGTIPWITTSLVDFNVIQESEEYITERGLEHSSAKVFPKGTLLIAMYGQGQTRGKVAILGIEAATNQA